jgi:hypothetical protein
MASAKGGHLQAALEVIERFQGSKTIDGLNAAV